MMKYIFTALLSFLLANIALSAPDAHTILSNADVARGGGLPGVEWEIQLLSRTGAKIDEPQRLMVKVVGEASVAEVLEPVRSKGSKILQVDRNMWLTKPGLSKPIPISPRQRMSGQAANGDIAATNYAQDYEAQMSGNERVDGNDCYVLELSSKNKLSTYDRIRYFVSVKQGVGIKAEFYSVSGKLLKSARFEYKNSIEHEGKRNVFVSKMIIRDALIDAETTMEMGAVKVKKIAAADFDLGQMQ
jgi:Outer membrane lipoprotein-sorting protein